MNRIVFSCGFVSLLLFASPAFTQKGSYNKEANVVYGSVSGAALLMDVYHAERPNGLGIIYIPGCAFGVAAPPGYDQQQLKNDVELDSTYTGQWVKGLSDRGYTVFVISHRFAPAFNYKDIINDCKRAVRFIKYHALTYGINPHQIGAMGHSSGGNLSALMGTNDDNFERSLGKTDSTSCRVQAVVCLATPFDLSDYKAQDTTIDNDFAMSVMKAYVGELPEFHNGNFVLSGKYASASPLSHVSAGDAPTLIYYSDNDPIIPPRQAIAMQVALTKHRIPVKAVERKGQHHSPAPDMQEVDSWFKNWLK